MVPTRPPYLFNPATVEARIASLPLTAALIHEKKRAGEPSDAFPALEITDREILRILGRSEIYAHLDELLKSLERCLSEGWDAHQLGARDRDEFASLMSDLQVAEHCLIRGFTLRSPVGVDLHGVKPDLFAQKDDLAVVIEVFRPRELPAFHDFLTDATRLLHEADIPLDYGAEVKLGVISDFDADGRLVSPWHPIALEDALAPVAPDALAAIAEKLGSLQPSPHDALVLEWAESNLKVMVEFASARRRRGHEPVRSVTNSKGYGGYDRVGMLARLIPPIINKAKKRQAGERDAATRVLVCDVSDTIVAAHLQDAPRQHAYRELLTRELGPQLERNYDVIALAERSGWGRPLEMRFAVCDDAYHGVLQELFGRFETLPTA
jgi:hypothetical protein